MADRFRQRSEDTIWLGGRFTPPFFVENSSEAYRVEGVLWMELPSELIVGSEMLRPEETSGAVGRVLREALRRPMAGPPRRPARIRVADAALVAEVVDVVGGSVPVEVAPTPELDKIVEALVASGPAGDGDVSYLGRGRIAPAAVARLFEAARTLYVVAPWKLADDDCVLRMDIPALAVKGACVSIIGAQGTALGVILFPSLAGYRSFLHAAQDERARGRRGDLGTGWLALHFERVTDLSPSMRREAMAHGWPVAGDEAYPVVERRERDGSAPPLVERDLHIATACASALTGFAVKHATLLRAERPEPVSETWTDDQDLAVRLTLPYEAFPFFEPLPEGRPAATARVGRNDPCPCGSGRKYKKCHGGSGASAAPAATVGHHERDAQWVKRLVDFACSQLGDEWERFVEDFTDPAAVEQFAVSWGVYGYDAQGKTVVARYLERHGPELAPADREWLTAQGAAWLSVWEVTAVEPGQGITLRDMLSGETRQVREAGASETLVVHDTMLARVVDLPDVSLLCGVHPRPLPPIDGADVVRRTRVRLRGKGAVPRERLRGGACGSYLIRRWEEAVRRLDQRFAVPPVLTNTDGDPLLLTIDHFEIAADRTPEVEARIAALEHVRAPDLDDEEPCFVFSRPGSSNDNVIVGSVSVEGTALRAETNSQARADALRARIEAACGARVRHRAREHVDPLSSRVPLAAKRPPEPHPPEVRQALAELERRHYAAWLDEAIPALGGKTPRAAVRTAAGRAAVDTLLKDFENRARRAKARAGGFDFGLLRRELGLE